MTRREASEILVDIGAKIRDVVDNHRGEALEHKWEADKIEDAWKAHDYSTLLRMGVVNLKDIADMERALEALES
jgi:hypothetical protein